MISVNDEKRIPHGQIVYDDGKYCNLKKYLNSVVKIIIKFIT